MSQRSVLFTNALLISDDEQRQTDVLVENGRIARIDGSIAAPDNAEVIDARGRWLLPGMIDDQVHFREPGFPHKGDIGSESRAAVAGGITSFMEMPNTHPPTTDLDALEDKFAIARRNAAANYSFYFGATNDNADLLPELDATRVCGVKIFMGSSTGNMLVDEDTALHQIFDAAPGVITTHCESDPMIQANLDMALKEYGPKIPIEQHPVIRSAEACYASSSRAVSLAREHGAQLHILHLTTAKEMELFEPGPVAGKNITAEVCVHHLMFDERDYSSLGNRIKCNPAVKSADDRAALIRALKESRIDILATDHAPHTLEEKAATDYRKAPAGLPLAQDVLIMALQLHFEHDFSMPEVVRKFAHNVTDRYRVVDRGYVREGYWADLVLVDPDRQTEFRDSGALSRCGWTPFNGRRAKGAIDGVWVNGVQAFDGQRVIEHDASQELVFQGFK